MLSGERFVQYGTISADLLWTRKAESFMPVKTVVLLWELRENTDYDKFRDIVALNGGGRDLGLPLCIELLDTPSGLSRRNSVSVERIYVKKCF